MKSQWFKSYCHFTEGWILPIVLVELHREGSAHVADVLGAPNFGPLR